MHAFELWCWSRVLRVPWTARRSNQSILKEMSPDYSLEGLMLKLQYFGHLMWRVDSLEKTLLLGETEGRKRPGWQKMRWLDGITVSMDNEQTLGQGGLTCCNPRGRKESDVTEWLNNRGWCSLDFDFITVFFFPNTFQFATFNLFLQYNVVEMERQQSFGRERTG